MATPLILALDLGTSSIRAGWFDLNGVRLADSLVQATYPLHTDRAGKAELSAVDLLAGARQVITGALSYRAGKRALASRPIAAVGMSCFWHSLVGCSDDGTALTPVLTWADSRAKDDAQRLRKELDEREVHSRTGCMLRVSFWPAKLRWLRRTQPAVFRSIAWFLSPADWLVGQLAGLPPEKLRTAHGMATGTGCYDPGTRAWDPGMLEACRLDRRTLLAIDDAGLRQSPMALFPELADTAWFPGIGDGAANNLGAGATAPGLAAINVGTSAAIRLLRRDDARTRPLAPFGLFCYRVDAQRHLIGGAISNAGSLRAWCLQHLRLPDEAAIEAALADRPGPDHGLSVLPFWMAERAPTWREDLTGVIAGITQSTTAVDLLHAITEAGYQRLATIADLLPGRRPTAIVGGGIQKSVASLQRLADITGLRLVACEEPETSLRGAAVCAIERLGAADRISGIGGRTVDPRPALKLRYAAQRRQLARLESTLFPEPAAAS
ncbi:gluconokinase [Planctomycetota bacterium]|nr:gluconokinase [Planctomycetota bacterium]